MAGAGRSTLLGGLTARLSAPLAMSERTGATDA